MQQITIRQREIQREKIESAIKLLELAVLETFLANTPAEIAESLTPALEIITEVNEFLISQPKVNYNYICGCDSPTSSFCMRCGTVG